MPHTVASQLALAVALSVGVSCASHAPRGRVPTGPASRAADAAMLLVPAGAFIAGSTRDERERAYADYLAAASDDPRHRRKGDDDLGPTADHARAGRWFDREAPRHHASLAAFLLDTTPVTNAAYAEFVRATGRDAPAIDEPTWRAQQFVQPYALEVARFNWTGAVPPAARAQHPVVLVTHADAADYCAWRGRRLPTAAELEKAMRGTDGLTYPWGNAWDPTRTNGAHRSRDTTPVGQYPDGAAPWGHLDLAGNVFHWTSTPWPARPGSYTLKGSAWDDHAGVGRGAQRHGRPGTSRHAIIGFRCAADAAAP